MDGEKKRDVEIATGVAELVMLAALLCLIVPVTRDFMFGMGFVAFGLILGAVLGSFFIILYRHLYQEMDLPVESPEVLLNPQSDTRTAESVVIPEDAASGELVLER